MKWWPFSKKRPANAEATAALWEAHRALRDADDLYCRAEVVANKLEETRRRNHFGEAVTRAIRGV